MSRKSLNQTGFTAIEAALIVVIVIILGGTGYYVYHTNKKTTDINNSAAKVAQSSPDKKTAIKNGPNQSAQKYFTITEWGVRAPYSGSLTLEYSFDGKDAAKQTANFNSAQLKTAAPTTCTDGIEGGGLVIRYAPTDHVYGEDGADLGSVVDYFASTNDPSSANRMSHVGNYYYRYVHPQAPCGDSSVDSLQTQTDDAVSALVQHLQAE